jgi:hypothetical protein
MLEHHLLHSTYHVKVWYVLIDDTKLYVQK